MNLYHFKLLNRQAQVDMISNKGVFLTTLDISEHTIDIYKVHNFYVKVFYSKTNDEVNLRAYYSIDVQSIHVDEWSGRYFNETLSKIAYLY